MPGTPEKEKLEPLETGDVGVHKELNPPLEPKRELRFREIYDSPEWKQLDPSSRGQLLLVAEGEKPGALIETNYSSFRDIINKMGLEIEQESPPGKLGPVVFVALPDKMRDYLRKLIARPKDETLEEEFQSFWKIQGEALGYPDCCTAEYASLTGEETARVNLEMEEMIAENKEYPAELDFAPPAFTPCKASCENALPLLRRWRDLLKQADPEAAQAIREWNISQVPFRKAHSKEVTALEQREREQEKIKQLRGSILRNY